MPVRRSNTQKSFLTLSPRRPRGLSGIFKRNNSKSRSDSGHGWLPDDIDLMQTFNELGVETFFRATSTVVYEGSSGLALTLPRSVSIQALSRSASKQLKSIGKKANNSNGNGAKSDIVSASTRVDLLNLLIGDLLQHETNYLKSLVVLHEGFELPLQSKFCSSARGSKVHKFFLKLVGKNSCKPAKLVVTALFQQIGQLIDIHSRLRDELVSMTSMYATFGRNVDVYAINCMTVFLGKCITEMSIYSELTKQQVQSLCAFENIRYTNDKFAAEVARCEEMTGYNLHNLLQEVRQSIWYYIGLVEKFGHLCTPQEYANTRTHLEYLKGIYRHMGPYLRQIDMISQLTKLQNRIIGLTSPLARLNVELLYEGEFQYQSGKHTTTSKVYCWLFTDQLVIAKYAQNDQFVHEATFSLSQTHLVESNHSRIAYLHGDSSGQLNVWQNAIEYAMRINASRKSIQ
ncbi:hypothetical protein BDF22DRAFT_674888 [Syncephalis plumigaleata]|nr:hypothetical protein BDF22DRAFT_674888 [Syncephalis plumigaleata]